MINTRTVVANPRATERFIFTIPLLAEPVTARVGAALYKVEKLQAIATEATKKAAKDHTHRDAATEADAQLHNALISLRDLAAATAGATKTHHTEQYAMAAARFERARQEAVAALHDMAAHGALYTVAATDPTAIGLPRRNASGSAYARAMGYAARLAEFNPPPIDQTR